MKRVCLAFLAVALSFGSARAHAQEFVVVVNADNPTAELSKSEVSDMFFKKQGRWSNGNPVVPVDLAGDAGVRDAFSRAIHGRPASAVLSHWQQQIFAGRDVPPAERGSDADVLSFVRGNANGIGYVAASASLGAGVKTITIK